MSIKLVGIEHEAGDFPFTKDYSPFVATANTAMLFRHIPKTGTWGLPVPLDLGSIRDVWDEDFKDWIHYLDDAKRGFDIAQKVASGKGISGAKSDFHAYLYLKESGVEVSDKIINSMRRVFLSLMSEQGRQKNNFEEPDGVPNQEDIRVTRVVVENFDLRNS